MNFNIGDKVKLKADHGYCYLGENEVDYLKISNINDLGGMDYIAFDSEGNGLGSCSCWTVRDVELYEHVYKVGDKLVPNQSLKNDCGCEWHDAAYIQITTVGGNDDYYYYDVYEANGDYIEACSGHEGAFKDGMEYYKEIKQDVDVPLAPINSFVGSGTTTMHPGMTVQSIAPTARIGWMDEPVFIPKEEPKEEPVGTINIVPVTNAKHSANLRKLIGHRNFKSRVSA